MSEVVLRGRRILIDGRPRLLVAGELHYFRLGRADWADRIRRLAAAGGDTVATYVPWVWHELPDRTVDLHGRTHPQRDVAGFLDLVHALGLTAIVRPGPFVMAELKNEGIPYRVRADSPHLSPTTWDGRPTTSLTLDYLAPEFLTAVEGWYSAILPVIAERLAPRGGPVVGVQLDNEIGMLSWVTNAPELTDSACVDIGEWAVDRYGVAGAAARAGASPDDPAAWAAALRRPAEPHSLAVHDDIGLHHRDRYRRYVRALRASAERHGITGVPLLLNVHGTGGGRARAFGVGISQLRSAIRSGPQLTAGSDLYLGDLTVGNVADLYVANAFLAAAHGPDQPLTSLEFEVGSGNYGEDLAVLVPPEAVELKTRLCVAQGNRLLNLYLFAGGHNPPLDRPVGDGNDRIGGTGERHGFAAPVDPDGRTTPGYDAIRRVLAAVRGVGDLLADSDQEHDGLALGFVPDHYLTEYHHPASAARAAQVAELERFRGTGSRDILARALVLGGYSFPAVDLQSTDAELPALLVLASARTLRRSAQERLVDHLRGGGRLLLAGALPDRDHDGSPCTLLADELGLRVTGRLLDGPGRFPSVVGRGPLRGTPEVRVGHAELLTAPPEAEPVLVDAASGAPCAVLLPGRAVVVTADHPCHLDTWRTLIGALGVHPRVRHDATLPGLVVTSTVDPSGQRLLHLLNVGPSAVTCAVTDSGRGYLDGHRLHVAARTGLMLPAGVRVGPAVLTGSTFEVVRRTPSGVELRPTQPGGADVAEVECDRPVRVRGGTATRHGRRVRITTSGPTAATVEVVIG